jgi:MFS superfamily sulfate permease-like transporter
MRRNSVCKRENLHKNVTNAIDGAGASLMPTADDDNVTGAVLSQFRPWPVLQGFQGWRPGDLGADALAGLTLAAIAIPEQMATARLGGLGPEVGFLALIGGAVGFAIFGANRRLSVGADSTIAPIFAGALALLAPAGGAAYAGDAALLALLVGVLLLLAGAMRLGFIADLLSIPVTTGFLAGIAVHILASQLPPLMGLPAPPGPTPEKLWALAEAAGHANPFTLALGLGVTAFLLIGEKLAPRFPSALAAIALATLATLVFGLESHGVETLGIIAGAALKLSAPPVSYESLRQTAGLAVIVAIVVMVQTAATTRGFVSDPERGPDVDRDFIGVGAANLFAGFLGAFPVDASPPRTAVVVETGGRSQLGGLIAAALALALALFGAGALAHVPHAALAGILLFVAQRIVRVGVMAEVLRRSWAEFMLIVVTLVAIVALPIEQGVGAGIALSILHCLWTITRARVVEYQRIPGTSIWWPKSSKKPGETVPGVRVIGLQAPLSFLNAYEFQAALSSLSDEKLLVIEANAIVELDYTGAKILGEAIARLQARGVVVAVARLESLRAEASFARQGLTAMIGEARIFHSVEEAVRALAPAVRS